MANLPTAPPLASVPRLLAPAERAIELKLNTIMQLFNSFDPSPFLEKDLDDDAEAYIVSTARELPLDRRATLRLVLHLPPEAAATVRLAEVEQAIRNYFAYREEGCRRELRQKLRQGRLSLLIGLAFLFSCIALREFLAVRELSTLRAALTEGLLIAGWVAMWGPIHIFLYEWWPIAATRRLYGKLRQITLEVRVG